MAAEYVLFTDGRAKLDLAKVKIDQAASGAVFANSTGQRLRIYQLFLSVATTVTVTFKSGSTALTGAATVNAGVPLVLDFSPLGWFDIEAAESFTLTLGSGVQVSGNLVYAPLG